MTDFQSSYTITKHIDMQPFGKARPRVTRNGTFMPRDYEAKKHALRYQFGAVPDGLVHLSVTAVRPLPKSWSKKKRLKHDGCYAHPKPDADNIVGAVMDALFDEDDRVVSIFCEKVWGEKAGLVIEVAVAGERPL